MWRGVSSPSTAVIFRLVTSVSSVRSNHESGAWLHFNYALSSQLNDTRAKFLLTSESGSRRDCFEHDHTVVQLVVVTQITGPLLNRSTFEASEQATNCIADDWPAVEFKKF